MRVVLLSFLLEESNPIKIGRKLNVHKMFKRHPGNSLKYLLYNQFLSWGKHVKENAKKR